MCFLNFGFLRVYAQEWDCWVIWWFYSQFFKESPYHLPQWLYQFTFSPTVQEGSLFSTSSPVFQIIDLDFWFENIVVKNQITKPNSCLVKMFSIHNITIFFRSSEFLGCQIFILTKMHVLNSFLKIMDYFGLCTPLILTSSDYICL